MGNLSRVDYSYVLILPPLLTVLISGIAAALLNLIIPQEEDPRGLEEDDKETHFTEA